MKIVKKLGSALIVILVLAAIILVSYFAVSRLVTEVTGLIRDFPDLYEQTETGLEKIGQTLRLCASPGRDSERMDITG